MRPSDSTRTADRSPSCQASQNEHHDVLEKTIAPHLAKGHKAIRMELWRSGHLKGSCPYRREAESDQGCNFESRLLQEVLQRLGVRCAPHPFTHSWTAWWSATSKWLRSTYGKVVASHQRDWDERLPLFLLAYRASTHDTTGLTPVSLVFGRELRLP
jgi:hypothetical protein